MVYESDKLPEDGRRREMGEKNQRRASSKKSEKRRKKKNSPGKLLKKLLIFLSGLCVVAWIASGFFPEEESVWSIGREAEVEPPEDNQMPDWITQQFLPVNEYSRPGKVLEQVNGIVVHYVANPGSTGWENWHYFEGLAESHTTKAGAHFIIGLDGTVIQCVPLDELTYCSNNRNADTISIECCHPEEDGKFTEETYNSLVKLCRWLINYYGLDKEDVIRHYDVTGKLCPLYFVEHEDAWEEFKNNLE